MQHSLRRQRGLSFVSVVLIGVLLVAAFAIGGQSVPIFTEYMAVQKAAQKAADEADQRHRAAAPPLTASASIDDIRSINGKDLEVSKNGDRFTVHYEYEREIGLAGPSVSGVPLQRQHKVTHAR